MNTLEITPALRARLAPSGTLRASINLGNPILARLDADGQPAGVSIDLARGLAEALGLPLALVVFDAAGKSVEAVTREEADFGFFAIDPVRSGELPDGFAPTPGGWLRTLPDTLAERGGADGFFIVRLARAAN